MSLQDIALSNAWPSNAKGTVIIATSSGKTSARRKGRKGRRAKATEVVFDTERVSRISELLLLLRAKETDLLNRYFRRDNAAKHLIEVLGDVGPRTEPQICRICEQVRDYKCLACGKKPGDRHPKGQLLCQHCGFKQPQRVFKMGESGVELDDTSAQERRNMVFAASDLLKKSEVELQLIREEWDDVNHQLHALGFSADTYAEVVAELLHNSSEKKVLMLQAEVAGLQQQLNEVITSRADAQQAQGLLSPLNNPRSVTRSHFSERKSLLEGTEEDWTGSERDDKSGIVDTQQLESDPERNRSSEAKTVRDLEPPVNVKEVQVDHQVIAIETTEESLSKQQPPQGTEGGERAQEVLPSTSQKRSRSQKKSPKRVGRHPEARVLDVMDIDNTHLDAQSPHDSDEFDEAMETHMSARSRKRGQVRAEQLRQEALLEVEDDIARGKPVKSSTDVSTGDRRTRVIQPLTGTSSDDDEAHDATSGPRSSSSAATSPLKQVYCENTDEPPDSIATADTTGGEGGEESHTHNHAEAFVPSSEATAAGDVGVAGFAISPPASPKKPTEQPQPSSPSKQSDSGSSEASPDPTEAQERGDTLAQARERAREEALRPVKAQQAELVLAHQRDLDRLAAEAAAAKTKYQQATVDLQVTESLSKDEASDRLRLEEDQLRGLTAEVLRLRSELSLLPAPQEVRNVSNRSASPPLSPRLRFGNKPKIAGFFGAKRGSTMRATLPNGPQPTLAGVSVFQTVQAALAYTRVGPNGSPDWRKVFATWDPKNQEEVSLFQLIKGVRALGQLQPEAVSDHELLRLFNDLAGPSSRTDESASSADQKSQPRVVRVQDFATLMSRSGEQQHIHALLLKLQTVLQCDLTTLFDRLDADRNGSLDLGELRDAIRRVAHISSSEFSNNDIASLFDRMRRPDNQSVTEADFRRWNNQEQDIYKRNANSRSTSPRKGDEHVRVRSLLNDAERRLGEAQGRHAKAQAAVDREREQAPEREARLRKERAEKEAAIQAAKLGYEDETERIKFKGTRLRLRFEKQAQQLETDMRVIEARLKAGYVKKTNTKKTVSESQAKGKKDVKTEKHQPHPLHPKRRCVFQDSTRGCHLGDACRFSHDDPAEPTTEAAEDEKTGNSPNSPKRNPYLPRNSSSSAQQAVSVDTDDTNTDPEPRVKEPRSSPYAPSPKKSKTNGNGKKKASSSLTRTLEAIAQTQMASALDEVTLEIAMDTSEPVDDSSHTVGGAWESSQQQSQQHKEQDDDDEDDHLREEAEDLEMFPVGDRETDRDATSLSLDHHEEVASTSPDKTTTAAREPDAYVDDIEERLRLMMEAETLVARLTPLLGMSLRTNTAKRDPRTREQKKTNSCTISAVRSEGPAYAAGLRVGWQLQLLNGIEVVSNDALLALCKTVRPGDRVAFQVHNGRTLQRGVFRVLSRELNARDTNALLRVAGGAIQPGDDHMLQDLKASLPERRDRRPSRDSERRSAKKSHSPVTPVRRKSINSLIKSSGHQLSHVRPFITSTATPKSRLLKAVYPLNASPSHSGQPLSGHEYARLGVDVESDDEDVISQAVERARSRSQSARRARAQSDSRSNSTRRTGSSGSGSKSRPGSRASSRRRSPSRGRGISKVSKSLYNPETMQKAKPNLKKSAQDYLNEDSRFPNDPVNQALRRKVAIVRRNPATVRAVPANLTSPTTSTHAKITHSKAIRRSVEKRNKHQKTQPPLRYRNPEFPSPRPGDLARAGGGAIRPYSPKRGGHWRGTLDDDEDLYHPDMQFVSSPVSSRKKRSQRRHGDRDREKSHYAARETNYKEFDDNSSNWGLNSL